MKAKWKARGHLIGALLCAAMIGAGAYDTFHACPDCPDAVVDTVSLDSVYAAGVFNGRCMVLEYWSQCVQGLDPDDSLIFSPPHAYYENCADSIAVLNEQVDSLQSERDWWRATYSEDRDLWSAEIMVAVDSILLHGGVWTIFDGDTAVCFMWKTWRQWQQAKGW